MYTCVCERACVHKVPPCKCLIVCVENNSPIPQGMKQARKRPGPQTSRDPQGTGPPGETPQGQPPPPPRKGQRRARRRDLRQPQCRRPRVPWRRAVQLIEFDSHAHLVSKAGSVIGAKSPSPVFKRSGS